MDKLSGDAARTLEGHPYGRVLTVCPVTVNGRHLLASGGYDQTVRVWDPSTGASLITIPVRYQALAVSQAATLLAIGPDSQGGRP